MAERSTWIVTAKREAPLRKLADELEKLGFEVHSILEEVGSIVGTIDSKLADRIRQLPGVHDIAKDAALSIGPPGKGETW